MQSMAQATLILETETTENNKLTILKAKFDLAFFIVFFCRIYYNMFMEKYYKLLGLNQSSSFEELKKSRNDLLKKYHPDYYLGNKKYAQEKTAKINEAYQKLKPIFEAKEEKEIEKFDEILGKNQTIKPNKKVVEKVAKFQPEKKKTINKTSISTEKTQKKEQTKKRKSY